MPGLGGTPNSFILEQAQEPPLAILILDDPLAPMRSGWRVPPPIGADDGRPFDPHERPRLGRR